VQVVQRSIHFLAVIAVAVLMAAPLAGSGYIGVYGIVEKVVVEPNETTPERIQIWGAFAFVNGTLAQSSGVTAAKRGYLYFRMPATASERATEAGLEAVRREWADLRAIAGTGQAVGFGRWQYIGDFAELQPDQPAPRAYVLERAPVMTKSDLRVRPATETPASPALYQVESGIVKLTESGSHASVVKMLKDALLARVPSQ
jgi:hypothetical protein